MIHKLRSLLLLIPTVVGVSLLLISVQAHPVGAVINQLPTPDPKPGSFGLEAVKKQAPPTQAATITTPGSSTSFTSAPITVNGICPDGLLVQTYNNGVMVGSTLCKNGSFSVQVSLFAGTNELSAIVYDDLEQAGPTSNIATVTYTDTRFSAFGAQMTLTSSYGRRSAAAGAELSWPLQLSGGNGPYAYSLDWGDGSAAELKSQAIAGLITIAHTYSKAGIYQVNVKVTDTNGVSAFLQLTAVSNGKVDASATAGTTPTTTVTTVLWLPAAIALVLLVPAYWLGRRSQLVSIKNKLLKERDGYKQ